MNLDFPRPLPAGDAELPAADMALLVAVLAERLGGSATARAQAAVVAAPADMATEPLLAPAGGAFNTAMAARITAWKEL